VVVLGYNTVVASPGSPSSATVYGYLYDIAGAADSGLIVYARRIDENAYATDTAGNVIVTPLELTDTTDATGYFGFILVRTNQYASGSGLYYLWSKKGNRYLFEIDSLTVPSTGNLEITDSVMVRQ